MGVEGSLPSGSPGFMQNLFKSFNNVGLGGLACMFWPTSSLSKGLQASLFALLYPLPLAIFAQLGLWLVTRLTRGLLPAKHTKIGVTAGDPSSVSGELTPILESPDPNRCGAETEPVEPAQLPTSRTVDDSFSTHPMRSSGVLEIEVEDRGAIEYEVMSRSATIPIAAGGSPSFKGWGG